MSNTKPGSGDTGGGSCFPVPRAKAATLKTSSWRIPRTVIIWMIAIVLLSLASGTAAASNAVVPDSLSSNQTILQADNQMSTGTDGTVHRSGGGSSNGNSNNCNTKTCGCGGCNSASGSTPSGTIPGLLFLFCSSMALFNAIGSWPSIPPQALYRAASPGHGNRVNNARALSWKIPGPLIIPIIAMIILSFTIQAAAEPNVVRPVSSSINQTIFHGDKATSMIHTNEDSDPRSGPSSGGGGGSVSRHGVIVVITASGSTSLRASPGLLFLFFPIVALAKAVNTWQPMPPQTFPGSPSSGFGNRVNPLGNWALCASFLLSIISIGMALSVIAARTA